MLLLLTLLCAFLIIVLIDKINSEIFGCLFQFHSYDLQDGRIKEWEFADMLLTYSSFQEKKKQRILRKVKKSFKGDSQVGNQWSNEAKLV